MPSHLLDKSPSEAAVLHHCVQIFTLEHTDPAQNVDVACHLFLSWWQQEQSEMPCMAQEKHSFAYFKLGFLLVLFLYL